MPSSITPSRRAKHSQRQRQHRESRWFGNSCRDPARQPHIPDLWVIEGPVGQRRAGIGHVRSGNHAVFNRTGRRHGIQPHDMAGVHAGQIQLPDLRQAGPGR